jgi:decaprenylphospho-beta-D-ribofuranose 2-oxidase
MPSAEMLTRAGPAANISPRTVQIHGWGGCHGATAALLEPDRAEMLPGLLQRWHSAPGAIARGMGRSYGDAAQLDGGLVLQMTRQRDFELDPEGGTVTAQAGATIGQLLAVLVPAGWMVPVVPGTQHVSIGGAIASDIHGKNHAVAGTFGAHVERLGLLTSTGETLELSPDQKDGLFEATVGGMGLTGVILWAQIRLLAISSSLMSVDTDRARNLDEALAVLSAPGGSYRVAWLDLLGSPPGRGVVTRAEHLAGTPGQPSPPGMRPGAPRGGPTVRSRATVPARWPSWPLRPSAVRAFNELRFRRTPRRQREHPEAVGHHLFPLDALDAWPRLYGPAGFLQYQLVVPYGSEDVIRSLIEQLRRGRLPCYLAVLKDFGAASEAPLSFPIPGWTLTLDIPRRAPGLDEALQRFDELVAACGGRVYLSKDVRLAPDALAAMYPRLQDWKALRERADPDRLWRSDLGRRTGLVAAGR